MNFTFILGFTTIIMGIILIMMTKRYSKRYGKEMCAYDITTVFGTIGWLAILFPITMFSLYFCLWYSMNQ